MKKLSTVVLSVIAVALLLTGVALADDMKGMDAKGGTGTWKGEIVDIACQSAHPQAKGASHADCAKKCLKNGQPMGLLTADGDMILLVASHDDSKPFEAAKDLAGTNVEVTGTMAKAGGMQVVTVASVKPAA